MNPPIYSKQAELVKTMLSPDDVLTDEDERDILDARAALWRGDFVRDDEIDWK